jgi:hypothetical protein
MPNFSPTDAAFEGFRFTRERPGAVASWAATTFGFNLASGLLGALIGGSKLADLQALTRDRAFDLATGAELLWQAAPALVVTSLVNLLGVAVIYPSALRAFLGIDRSVSFRFGQDERRLVILLFGMGVIYFAASALAGVIFGFVENIVIALDGDLADTASLVGAVAVVVSPLVVIVRLSLAPVIAVDRKRISLKESWVSTKGHFWPLAGSLLLSIGLYVIVGFVAMMLVATLVKLASIGTGGAISGPSALTNAELTTLKDILAPAVIFSQIVAAIAVALALPIVFGPLVRAYQAYDAPDAKPAPIQA